MGNRFAQEIYFLEPNEDKLVVRAKLSQRMNLNSKETKQIVEGEYVLLNGNGFECIGFVREISSEYIVKIITSKAIPTTIQSVKLIKLINATSYIKTAEALRCFTADYCCSNDLHDIVFSSITENYTEITSVSTRQASSGEHYIRNQYLNPSQQEALIKGVSQTFTLIQGPPGTGKTTTAVEIVLEWLRVDRKNPVLVCADSNIAVDVLYGELMKAGVNVFRMGYKYNDIDDDFKNKHSIMKKSVIDADVICATCVGCTSEYLKEVKFTRILIDEATQSTELSTIIPFTRGAKQVILIGDHKQLPPTVLSVNAVNKGLSISLFERLISRGIIPILLNTQYRMHPMISFFPSKLFYDNMILNGVTEDNRKIIEGFKWPNDSIGIAFIQSKGSEKQEGSSFYNKDEAFTCVDLFMYFMKYCNLKFEDVGIITPYDCQKRKIKELIFNNIPNLDKTRLFVDTVDGFQGMEKELIIFSAVRSNQSANVGFLRDFRRLNVMLTRAKRGVVLVGNMQTLENDRYWYEWIRWAKENNLIINNY
jgi:superfamily I DNA and/or RNA helicase